MSRDWLVRQLAEYARCVRRIGAPCGCPAVRARWHGPVVPAGAPAGLVLKAPAVGESPGASTNPADVLRAPHTARHGNAGEDARTAGAVRGAGRRQPSPQCDVRWPVRAAVRPCEAARPFGKGDIASDGEQCVDVPRDVACERQEAHPHLDGQADERVRRHRLDGIARAGRTVPALRLTGSRASEHSSSRRGWPGGRRGRRRGAVLATPRGSRSRVPGAAGSCRQRRARRLRSTRPTSPASGPAAVRAPYGIMATRCPTPAAPPASTGRRARTDGRRRRRSPRAFRSPHRRVGELGPGDDTFDRDLVLVGLERDSPRTPVRSWATTPRLRRPGWRAPRRRR